MGRKGADWDLVIYLTIQALNRLARNIWWTWNQDARGIFGELSPRTWQNVYHNPVAILHEVSDTELRTRLMEPDYAKRVADVLAEFDAYLSSKDTWVTREVTDLSERRIAYFSAEFGLHETLPIAAGGLGVLAGDHIKSRQRPRPQLLRYHLVLSGRIFSADH